MPVNLGSNITVAFQQLRNFISVAAAYTAEEDDAIIKSSSSVITLQSPVNAGAGRVYIIWGADTVASVASGGTAIYTFTSANTIVTIISDGSNWTKVGHVT